MKRYYFCRETEARNAPEAIAFLSGAYRLDQQIETKMQQIASLREMAVRTNAVLGGDVVSHTRNVTGLQDAVHRIIEEEEHLNEKIDELVAKKREIEAVLEQLPDPFHRLVLEKRYICFLTWKEIAGGLYCSVRLAQEKHNEAVALVQEILENGSIAVG